VPRLHPRLADVYRKKVEQLHEALENPTTYDEALGILHELIEKVVVRARDSVFEIEFFGELANMMALPVGAQSAQNSRFRRSVKGKGGSGGGI
jgi:site-specific DNA recombinase